MSTMYYTYPGKEKIGQTHSLGKDKGYHFTWCMYPLEFAGFVASVLYREAVVDEYEHFMSVNDFVALVEHATSQSFDERIE